MRGAFFWAVTAAAALIWWFEWKKLNGKPMRDRVVFVSLLLCGWVLSMLDLPHTAGPITMFKIIFQPFRALVD